MRMPSMFSKRIVLPPYSSSKDMLALNYLPTLCPLPIGFCGFGLWPCQFGFLEILLKWLFLGREFLPNLVFAFYHFLQRGGVTNHCLCRHTCPERAVAPNAPLELNA